MIARRRKEVASLSQAKGRRRHSAFLVEGIRSVEAAVAARAPLVELLVTPETASDRRVEALLSATDAPVHVLASDELDRITSVQHDQGVAAVSRSIVTDDVGALDAARTVVALDGVQDPGNVGTLIRTAAWFGADVVLVGSGTADPESPKVVRSAAGGLWDVELVRTAALDEALDTLRDRGLAMWGADLEGMPVHEWNPASEGVLVLGSEAHGLSPAVAARLDGHVAIPAAKGAQGVESLNVAVAGGILLCAWLRA